MLTWKASPYPAGTMWTRQTQWGCREKAEPRIWQTCVYPADCVWLYLSELVSGGDDSLPRTGSDEDGMGESVGTTPQGFIHVCCLSITTDPSCRRQGCGPVILFHVHPGFGRKLESNDVWTNLYWYALCTGQELSAGPLKANWRESLLSRSPPCWSRTHTAGTSVRESCRCCDGGVCSRDSKGGEEDSWACLALA